MDPVRFDTLTKALLPRPSGAGSSRRHLLAAFTAGILGGILGLDHTAAKDKKKGKDKNKKKKKKCRGQKKKCGKKCIPSRACCNVPGPGQWLPEGSSSGQCGICINGKLIKDPVSCILIDPDGCTDCDGSTFTCVPAPDGTPCTCGVCQGGLCEETAGQQRCGGTCCSGQNPVCIDETTEQCCAENRACAGECCSPGTGGIENDREVCTREGCCLQVKAANNCPASNRDCGEQICCAGVWPGPDRGLYCPPGAGVPPDTRGYCCGPDKSCCFTGCCPDGSTCCGDNKNCCPDGAACGSESCFAPVPDHV